MRLFEEKNNNESVKKWRKLFGDKFGKLKSSKTSTAAGSAVVPTVSATRPYAHSD